MNPAITRAWPILLVLALAATAVAGEAEVNPATVPAPRAEDWWKATHERFVAEAKRGGVEVLFLGDSITDNWRTEGLEAWRERIAPLKAANFGITGDRTENLLWRLQNGELDGLDPKAVVLLIGTNNWMPGPLVAEGIAAVVKHLRTARPKAGILLLGVFPRDRHSADLDQWIQEINGLIAKLADGKQVVVLDLRDKFLAPEDKSAPGALRQFLPDVMKDGVHPSKKGYEVWADAIKEPLAKMLAK